MQTDRYDMTMLSQCSEIVKRETRKPNTLYKLLYNSQVIITNAPYGVCRSKQNDLQRQANYQSGIFKIVPCH